MLEGAQELLVDRHRLEVSGGVRGGLLLEAGALVVGIGQLGEAVDELAAVDEGLEALGELGVLAMASRQR